MKSIEAKDNILLEKGHGSHAQQATCSFKCSTKESNSALGPSQTFGPAVTPTVEEGPTQCFTHPGKAAVPPGGLGQKLREAGLERGTVSPVHLG